MHADLLLLLQSVLSETLVQGGLVKGHTATFVMEKSQHKYVNEENYRQII